MPTSNRYHRLLSNMLADIQGFDELQHFVHWRRLKGKALVAMEQGNTTESFVIDYLDGLKTDDEQHILEYVMNGMGQDQIKRRVRFLKKMKKINNRRVKNDLKSKYDLDPLFSHRTTYTIDNLIKFYDELGRLQRSSRPKKLARRTQKALAQDSNLDIIKIGKAEQQLYGNFSRICQKLGFGASRHDYEAAVKRHNHMVRWERRGFYVVMGTAMLALAGMVSMIFMPHRNDEIRDALADEVAMYIEDDHVVESDLELQLERTYGFDIVGKFTQEDLEDLQSRLGNSYPPEMVRLMGLCRIVIFDERAKSQVDYAGSAMRETGEMRLFSGNLGAIVDHEMAHFQTFTHQHTTSDFVERWQDLAGPYDNGVIVTYSRGPPERGSAAINTQYVSGEDRGAPFHGYMRAYGGVNYREDISTFVEAVRNQCLAFAQVTGDFPIYRQKLGLLRDYHYISNQEYANAMGVLRIAQDGGDVESISDGAPGIEYCLPPPEAL